MSFIKNPAKWQGFIKIYQKILWFRDQFTTLFSAIFTC